MSTALRLVKSNDLSVAGKRDYVNAQNQLEPKTGVLFHDFVFTTTTRKARRMGPSYMSNYKTVIYHLKRFSELYSANIYTNSVNEDFLDDFIVYLESEGLRVTYIKNIISLVKAMVRKAGAYGYAVDPTYDDVVIDDEDAFSVYLSMNEITRVYFFKGLTHKQQRIRDLFVIGCMTALRYSDYSTLTKRDFRGDYIDKVTKKTSKRVVLPIHDYVREIYDKYEGEVASGLTNQHFNRYIKKIMKLVGINEPITYSYTKGGELHTETKEKWELVTSHTARRSAATNMYLTGRMKTFEIMALTGHTTEKSFFRYIKLTGEDLSKHIASDNFFRK